MPDIGYYDSMMTYRALRLAAWLVLAFVIFATVSPIGLRPHDVLPVDLDRALAFTLMAVLFATAYPRHGLLVGFLIIAGAFAIEALQYLSPSRDPHLADAMVKAVGACVGVLTGMLLNGAIRTLNIERS